MKTCIPFFYFLLVSVLFADDLPRGVFEMDDLAEAQEKARARNKPIAFMISGLQSSCPRCVNATRDLLGVLDRSAIIVLFENRGDVSEQMRQGSREHYSAPPYTFLISADLNSYYGGAGYSEISSEGAREAMEPAFERFKNDDPVSSSNAGGQAHLEANNAGEDSSGELVELTNAEGVSIMAKIVSVRGYSVNLVLENGQPYTIDMDTLSEESQDLVRTYRD